MLLLMATTSAFEYFLPSIWAVPMAACASLTAGFFFYKKIQHPIKYVFLLFLAGLIVFGIFWLIQPRMFDKSNLLSYASIVAFGLFVGLFLSKAKVVRRFGFGSVFLLGWITASAQSNFNFSGDLVLSLGAYLAFFGVAGYILQREKTNIYKYFWFISPVVIVPLIEGLLLGASYSGQRSWLMPAMAIASLTLGCLLAIPKVSFFVKPKAEN